jgi:hypothetical protein
VENALADLRHEGLREGDTPTAMKSTGIVAIISRMTEIRKAQSAAIAGFMDTCSPRHGLGIGL